MQLDVGSEPNLSTAQALCLFINHPFYYESFVNWHGITDMTKSESPPYNMGNVGKASGVCLKVMLLFLNWQLFPCKLFVCIRAHFSNRTDGLKGTSRGRNG